MMGLLTRRRRFFVQRKFQTQFIAIFGTFALIAAVSAAVATGIAVDGALSEAMFRAHISQRSTGEIVLPVLLRVNSLVAAAAILGSFAAAAFAFRRSSAQLDDLCFRLAKWEWQLAGGVGDFDGPPIPDDRRHWTADLELAMLTADESLRLRYRPIAERAGRLAGAARGLEAALAEAGRDDRVGQEFEKIRLDIEALDDELSRFQEVTPPRRSPPLMTLGNPARSVPRQVGEYVSGSASRG